MAISKIGIKGETLTAKTKKPLYRVLVFHLWNQVTRHTIHIH
jgi:hypothetical protein